MPRERTRALRADAERSIEAILDAGLRGFSADPDVSMTAIAKDAGVGRVTLYTHFPSRELLLEAVFARAIAEAERVLGTEDLDGLPAPAALSKLIHTSWRILEGHSRLMTAVLRVLGPSHLRGQHRKPLARVEKLIRRGQAAGDFRTDLPADWLVTTFYAVLHGAASEVDDGRLAAAKVPDLLDKTLRAALAA